ncbi:hypothetical protein [Gudongella oleilytica]|uniref:hypothetical protein n=1 Tax=Gudongella oleilytica TaxID=1582259 RepID=UPI000FF8AAA7|nr:hypothetical protein [Gudongella oleilytica]
MIYAKVKNGQIEQYVSGFKPDGEIVEVPEEVFENLNRYDYKNGSFTPKTVQETVQNKSIERRVSDLEKLVSELMNAKQVE